MLHLLIRNHQLALPDDEELLHELASVRLRETSPGVVRMDHDADQHDDRAVALALAASKLIERPDGSGDMAIQWVSIPMVARVKGRRQERRRNDLRPCMPALVPRVVL